jgi:hypothetical protein
VRIRILKPTQRTIDGAETSRLAVGQTYDLAPPAATLLIAEGVAMMEMRQTADRRRFLAPPTERGCAHDRRKTQRR